MSKQRKSQVHTFPSLSKPWSALRTTRTLGDPWGTGPRFYSSGLKKTPSTQISCQTPSFLLEHIWPPPSPSSCGLNATEQDRSTTMVHINGVIRQQVSVTVWTKSTLHDWYHLNNKHPYGRSSQKAKLGSLGILHPHSPLKELSNSLAPPPISPSFYSQFLESSPQFFWGMEEEVILASSDSTRIPVGCLSLTSHILKSP